jgi:hypothetical protein
VAISTVYLMVSLVGFAYSTLLYAQYGLNVILFCEGSDFLLAPFRHPVSLFATFFIAIGSVAVRLGFASQGERELLGALLRGDRARYQALAIEQGEALLAARADAKMIGALGVMDATKLARLRAEGLGARRFLLQRLMAPLVYGVAIGGGVLIWCGLFVVTARNQADIVMAGGGAEDHFTVTTPEGARRFAGVLVGTTNNFVFVWDRSGTLLVLPANSVASIEVSR